MPRRLSNLASLIALSIGIDSAEEVGIRQHGQRNMKVTSALLTTMSGKLGGAVASRARGGIQYFRSLVTPSNPRSTMQSRVRLILSRLASDWLGLSQGQRDGWTAIAADEESGIDVYVRNNSALVLGGHAALGAAPDSASLATDPLTGTAVDASAHTVAHTNSTFDADQYVNVFVSAPQTESRGARRYPYRYIGTTNLDDAGAKTTAIPTTHPAYNAIAGQIVYVRYVQFHSGNAKVATAQEERVIVVA